MNACEVIENIKVVPVVVFNNTDQTIPMLNALNEGDIPVAEICFRTDCARECIKLAVKNFPQMLIGAGTVINAEQCRQAIEVGAKFIVSPGLSESVAKECQKNNIPYFPGVATPTEIMQALELGLANLKFFPASVYGGLKAIKALSSAFPAVRFMPTGGVSDENIKEFLEFDKIFACGGSWMVKGTPEEIKEKCLKTRKIIKGEN